MERQRSYICFFDRHGVDNTIRILLGTNPAQKRWLGHAEDHARTTAVTETEIRIVADDHLWFIYKIPKKLKRKTYHLFGGSVVKGLSFLESACYKTFLEMGKMLDHTALVDVFAFPERSEDYRVFFVECEDMESVCANTNEIFRQDLELYNNWALDFDAIWKNDDWVRPQICRNEVESLSIHSLAAAVEIFKKSESDWFHKALKAFESAQAPSVPAPQVRRKLILQPRTNPDPPGGFYKK